MRDNMQDGNKDRQVRVVLAGSGQRFNAFHTALKGLVSSLEMYPNGQAVLKKAAAGSVQIVVVDRQLDDMEGLALVNRLAENHPFVNTALVSSLSEHDFHEKTEGLGVLMQLPDPPNGKSAEKLLAHYRSIWG